MCPYRGWVSIYSFIQCARSKSPTSTMFLWRTLNNDALKLLSERQFEEAIIKFRYSLALISEKNFKSSILELGSSESDSLKLLPCPVPVQLDSQVFCNCHELSPDNLFNVYEKGFEFQDCTMHPPQHYILLTMDPLLLSVRTNCSAFSLCNGTLVSPYKLRFRYRVSSLSSSLI